MSDILTIDTGAGIIKEEKINPLPLYNEDHPMLRQAIPECDTPLPSPTITNLIKRLTMTMKLYGGVGLSANQCGVFERIFVIGTDQFQIACINPKVIEVSPDLVKDNEGCLSYPGMYLKIERPSWIVAEFTDEQGQVKQMKMEGVTARCFLHELDHMNGIRFVQHVGPVTLKLARQKQQKTIKNIVRKKKK